MTKNFKRILSMMLVLTMLFLATVPVFAAGADEEEYLSDLRIVYADNYSEAVAILAECDLFTVNQKSNAAFQNYNHEVVLWPAGFGIHNMVFTVNFTGEDIALNVSYALNCLFSENNRRFYTFLSHSCRFEGTNLAELANKTKYMVN